MRRRFRNKLPLRSSVPLEFFSEYMKYLHRKKKYFLAQEIFCTMHWRQKFSDDWKNFLGVRTFFSRKKIFYVPRKFLFQFIKQKISESKTKFFAPISFFFVHYLQFYDKSAIISNLWWIFCYNTEGSRRLIISRFFF